jgi:N-acetylglucosamine kinase-like BadF-type ATPase
MSLGREVVVAVDGGGSKTDAAVVDLATGDILGTSRGGGCSHHQIGIGAAVAVVDEAVTAALGDAGADATDVVHAGCYLTAIDLDSEQAAVHAALSRLPWAARSLAVDNDVFALLRAGTDAPDAAVVVCGTGFNGVAVRADGATARVLALGQISGDWGGASGLAEEVLWYAARAEDGRGEPTALREALLRWTGRASVRDVTLAVHTGELSVSQWWRRTPDIVEIANSGDPVAIALVERQGSEVGLLAAALLARLGLAGSAVPVVLGGGIGAAGDALLVAAAERVLAERAPGATLSIVTAPPISGAVHLALESARVRRTASA